MARSHGAEDKIRWLRAVAFHIQRKRPADEALSEQIGQESRGGKARQWRETAQALETDGFTAALVTGGFVGAEAAVLLDVFLENGDHRLLSSALNALATRLENTPE